MRIHLELNERQFKKFLLEIFSMLKEPFKFFQFSIGNVYVPVNIKIPRDKKALNYNETLVVTNSTKSPSETSNFQVSINSLTMKPSKKVTVLQPTFSTQTAALSQNGSSKSSYWNRRPLSDDLNSNLLISRRQSGINQYSTNTTNTRLARPFIQNTSSSRRHTLSVNENCVISNAS